VEFMLSVMRDENADPKRREWAAEKAAPYLHPRPTPVDRAIEIDLPDTGTIDGINAAQARLVDAVGRGEITPSEGQSISNLVDARRKAMETSELLRRIEKLEEAHSRPFSASRVD